MRNEDASPLAHHRAERQKRELGHLEALQAERNGDDRDAARDAREDIGYRHGDACKNQPEDIGDKRGRAAAVFDGLAERGEREARHFERLAPQRDADDAYIEQAADHKPPQRRPNTAEQNPDDIADRFHEKNLS